MERSEIRRGIVLVAVTAAAWLGANALDSTNQHSHEAAGLSPLATTTYFPEGTTLPGQDVTVHESIDSVVKQLDETFLPDSAGEYTALEQSTAISFPGRLGPLSDLEAQLQPQPTPEQTEGTYKEAVNAMGIAQVRFTPGTALPPSEVQIESGPYEEAFYELADIPQSIITASGLRTIELVPRDKKDFWYFSEPKHHDGTLVAPNDPDGFDVTSGLAGMILDNYYSPADRQKILQGLEAITHQAGKQYDPHYYYKYLLRAEPGTAHRPVTQKVATGNTLSGIALQRHMTLPKLEGLN